MIDKCHIHKNRMTLTKTVKDFSNTGKKLKETLEYAHMSHAHIGRINIIKMAILPNTIYIFNITPIKILMPFLTKIGKNIKIYLEAQTSKVILSKKPVRLVVSLYFISNYITEPWIENIGAKEYNKTFSYEREQLELFDFSQRHQEYSWEKRRPL